MATAQKRPVKKAAAKGRKNSTTKAVASAVQKVPVTWPREGFAAVSEAAMFLRCSRSLVYKLMNDGQLTWVHIGRDRRIQWPSLWALYEGGNPGSNAK